MIRWHKLGIALLAAAVAAPASTQNPAPAPSGGFSAIELRALVNRVANNQHHDDGELDLHERVERHTLRPNATDKPATEDKTWRVIPTGTGNVRVQLEDAGKPVDPALYRKQLKDAEKALENSNNPNLSQEKHDEARYAKRKKERFDLVEAAKDAFVFKFLGREQRDGRTLLRFSAEPNPDYKPVSRETGFFAYAHGIAWVDGSAEQVVRIEAEITKDISVGGGIIGKVYRGGKFVLEQSEIAPGVWLPTLYQFDVEGRRFLFGFSIHETIAANRYRRIGPPAEALAKLRNELSSTRSDP